MLLILGVILAAFLLSRNCFSPKGKETKDATNGKSKTNGKGKTKSETKAKDATKGETKREDPEKQEDSIQLGDMSLRVSVELSAPSE